MAKEKEKGKGKLIVICQSGGKFTSARDGSLLYTGGDAHATTVDHQSKFKEFKSEIAEMWKYDPKTLTMKYFLPGNKRTLITISSDKDVKRMLDFHEDSATVDVYIEKNGNPPAKAPALVRRSSSKITEVEPEPITPVYIPHVAEDGAIAAVDEIDDVGQHKLLKSWGSCITGLHQQFNNVQELREALRKYSVARGFTCKYKKNDGTRVTAKCKAEGCPWRVHASKLSTTPLFRIKTFNAMHTCGAGTIKAHHSRPTKKFMVSILKEKLCSTPNSKPKEIANQMREEFGIEMKYSEVWRGIEAARQELQGSLKESFKQLPVLCRKIVEANLGSVVTLNTREDRSFHRLFVALHASIYGFQNGCRPLLFLDTIMLNSNYQSDLLTATALDGNDDIFPVAFAIVDIVNDDNWYWFLLQLRSALSSFQSITFVADRRMGLRQSIPMVFENSYHGYCLDNLSEELEKGLTGPDIHEMAGIIVDKFYDAANAATLDGFRKCIEGIRSISPEAYNWVLASEPEHWANSLFQGSRYKHFTSGIGRSFYSCITDLPTIVQVIDTIRTNMMELMYTRRVDSNQWLTRLTPSVEDKLQKEILQAALLQVPLSTTNIFEVHCFGAINAVNIDACECSCREWQLNGFPCFHAVAVLHRIERNLYEYCSKYYATETFRLAYSESINPVPSVDKCMGGESSSMEVHPPRPRRMSGPPKQRRIRSKRKSTRSLRCSMCKGIGHNRITCHMLL